MAKPKMEDGFTPIANEILEHLMKMHLSSNQWQVLLCIIRKTYGFQKKVDWIANFQIVEATGLGKTVVSRMLHNLEDMNVINRQGKLLGFQKDWEKWQRLAELPTSEPKEPRRQTARKDTRSSQSHKLAAWHAKVFHRDGLTCRLCGRHADMLVEAELDLNAHHIFPWESYPELRFDVNNGLTMCEECHYCYHYATVSNTYEYINEVLDFRKLAGQLTTAKLAILHEKVSNSAFRLAEQLTKVSSPDVAQKKKETITNDTLQKKGDLSETFEIFWKAYPKKKSKGQAEKAFQKVNPDEQFLATMLATIERAKKSEDWQKDGGRFIPYPATWLNAKGWEDEFVEGGQDATHRGRDGKSSRRLPTTYRSPKEIWPGDDSAPGED